MDAAPLQCGILHQGETMNPVELSIFQYYMINILHFFLDKPVKILPVISMCATAASSSPDFVSCLCHHLNHRSSFSPYPRK